MRTAPMHAKERRIRKMFENAPAIFVQNLAFRVQSHSWLAPNELPQPRIAPKAQVVDRLFATFQ
jgi:hypothetical protein